MFGFIYIGGRGGVFLLGGGVRFSFTFFSFLFLFVIRFLMGVIFFYSRFYLSRDGRFFYFISTLFIFYCRMFILILSEGGWALLLFWDLLGIRRFFLIFYYISQRRVYGRLVTLLRGRFGDFLLFLFLFYRLSMPFSVSFLSLFIYFFLILVGITKRAQFPFMGWLPEAIAAPTPVRSLVHRRTLVTAGLVLFWGYSWVLLLGTVSSLLLSLSLLRLFFSGFLAFFEEDLKKLVALSTLSQISFCVFGISLGAILYFSI